MMIFIEKDDFENDPYWNFEFYFVEKWHYFPYKSRNHVNSIKVICVKIS